MEDHRVVAVILVRADQVLLCHRSPGRRWYPDVWDFPGGHVLPGERPQDALRREVAEELGAELEGVDGDPVLHKVDPEKGLDLTLWAAHRWRGSIANMQPEEHDAMGWFGKGQLSGLAFADPSYLGLLRDLLDGCGPRASDHKPSRRFGRGLTPAALGGEAIKLPFPHPL
jgi:8-oxo-dGTP diphosphatase